MSTLAQQVRRVLRDAAAPMTTHAIADAIETPLDISYLRTVMGQLVRSGEVVRHHDPAGLTYSLHQPRPSNAATTTPRMPITRAPRAGSTQARVLRLLAAKPMTSDEVVIAAHGSLSPRQVCYAMQELRRAGWVTGDRHKPVTWTHVAAQAPPPVVPAPPSIRALIEAAQLQLDAVAALLTRARLALLGGDELPPCVGERMRDATDDLRRNGVAD